MSNTDILLGIIGPISLIAYGIWSWRKEGKRFLPALWIVSGSIILAHAILIANGYPGILPTWG